MRHSDTGLGSLHFYERMSRLRRLSYRGKIMLVAFVGTHVPLLTLTGWYAFQSDTVRLTLLTLGVALASTLVGTVMTLLALHHLLRPISRTAAALHAFVEHGTLPSLPTHHNDTVGTLMADTMQTLHRLDNMLEDLEHRDAVTGLSNRAGLLRTLSLRIASKPDDVFAVCVIDLHGLKATEATLGLQQADRMLQTVVEQLSSLSTPGHTLHRVDATRLAIIMETDDPNVITDQLAAIKGRIDRTDPGDMIQDLDTCLGVALWPADDRVFDALLDDALVAAHIARRRGAFWSFYSEATRLARVEQNKRMSDLHKSVERGELRVHYQPVINTDTGAIVSAEALLRWQHPTLGLLPPGQFIALAESSDLILAIGLWTLDEVCRQHLAWRETDIEVPPIAVNLSARQLADPMLTQRIASVIERHSMPPGMLEVELTETYAATDLAQARRTMKSLRALGIGLSIDDFGTGYSSLSHLRTLPFSKIKIDREFVRDADSNAENRAICRALIAMAREMKLDVLAEGTETLAEVDTLRSHGCSTFQGFHFHRPLPPSEFHQLLKGSDEFHLDRIRTPNGQTISVASS